MELKKKPDHALILLRLAELARDAGQPKQAAEYLKKAVAADSNNVDARLELSRTLYKGNSISMEPYLKPSACSPTSQIK